MNVPAIIFCILIAQTSGSFFDEFRGAMTSVEHSFGRLIDDVVTDVRDTIGCTVLAVKQVLGFSGFFSASSEYDARCRGINPQPSYRQQERNVYYPPKPPVIITTTTPRISIKIPEIISDHIEESVKTVNYQIDHIDRTHETIDHVTNSLMRESDRLADIGSVLRRELTSISQDVKMELGKLESDTDNPKVQGLWNEIKDLHSIELSHQNTPEATVIHGILDDILSVLRGNSKRSDSIKKSPSPDLDNTYQEIQKQFQTIEKEQSQHLDMVQDIIKEDLPVKSEEDSSVTNKDANKIMDETSRTLSLSGNTKGAGEVATNSTEEASTARKIENDPLQSPDYADLFQIAPPNSDSNKEAVLSAQELIEQSKQADAFMENIMKQSSEVGLDIFDTPGMFDFGK